MVSTSSSGFHGRHSWIPGCSRTHLHDHDLAHWTLQFQSLCHTLGLTLWSHPTDGLLPTTFSTLWIYCYAYHKHCGDYDTSSVFQSMNQPVVTDQTDAFHCWKKTVHNLTGNIRFRGHLRRMSFTNSLVKRHTMLFRKRPFRKTSIYGCMCL